MAPGGYSASARSNNDMRLVFGRILMGKKTMGFKDIALVALLFIAVPGLMLGVFGYIFYQDLRVNFIYKKTNAIIISSEVDQYEVKRTGSAVMTVTEYFPKIKYTYNVNGKPHVAGRLDVWESSYRSSEIPRNIVRRYMKGEQVLCWYDPNVPDHAVLSKEFNKKYLFAIVPLLFLILGLIIVIGELRSMYRKSRLLSKHKVT